MLLNGDFVDRGTPPDFTLARQVISEELDGKAPWYYVPGNHEAEGGNGLANFQAVFGDTHRVVDLRGIRLVLLDSSRGLLRAAWGSTRCGCCARRSTRRPPTGTCAGSSSRCTTR